MKYKSSYYDKELNERQYIIEILLERQAAHKNIELPLRYCDYKKWENAFKAQLRALSLLLKRHDSKLIVAALRDKEFKWVYSLRNKYFQKNIDRFCKKEKNKPTINTEIHPSGQLTRTSQGDFSLNKKNSNLDILDG